MALQWIEDEFASLQLADKRLNERAKIITEDLSSMADSPPDSCQNASALEAAYRFANNPRVQPKAILDAHRVAASETRTRCKSRDARIARISIRATEVKLRGPERPGGRLPSVTLNVIEAVELDPLNPPVSQTDPENQHGWHYQPVRDVPWYARTTEWQRHVMPSRSRFNRCTRKNGVTLSTVSHHRIAPPPSFPSSRLRAW